jgi:hypothetical protein
MFTDVIAIRDNDQVVFQLPGLDGYFVWDLDLGAFVEVIP